MAIHREPNDREKTIIKEQHIEEGKIRCFVNNHPIEEESDIEYHHIKPYSKSGPTEVSNLAPVCKDHHRRIGTLSIIEYRNKSKMTEFFDHTEARKLSNVLELKIGSNNFGIDFKNEIIDFNINIYINEDIESSNYSLSTCPATGYKYFYIDLPIKYINNDEDLQPRPLEMRRLWELYRHLLAYTQLSPSIGRLVNNKIFIFDGQHKAAAQIWAGRKTIDCKIYINPDVKVLKETNLTAHDKLRQMPFFTSVLISKWADLFKEEWQEYLETTGEKSEAGFISFLVEKGKSKAEAINMIKSNIYDSIFDDENNLINEYISERNRSRKNPLTVYAIKQTIFKNFVTNPPLGINIEKLDELRELERKNLIELLNILTEETLKDKWDPENASEEHKVAGRIYFAGSLKAWTAMLGDVVAQVLDLYDTNERKKILLREVKEDKWEKIRGRIKHLFEHKVWFDPSPEVYNNLRINNEEQVRKYFINRGLTVNWILGGRGQ